MEDVGNRSGKKRGRKRKQIDVEKMEVLKDGRKRLREMRSKALVGGYVRKEFQGSGVYLGKVVGYDTGLYRVDYEDGDCEDLDSRELRHLLVEESELTDEWLERKTKLDNFVLTKGVKEERNPNIEVNNAKTTGLAKVHVVAIDLQVENYSFEVLNNDRVNSVDSSRVLQDDLVNSEVSHLAPVLLENGFADNSAERPAAIAPGFVTSVCGGDSEAVQFQFDIDGTTDSVSDSCEEDVEEDQSLEEEVPIVPCPELPPSSGNIGVPEEYVAHLFSVYSFLRSFSVQLFLYPFRLDDFVGSLNCCVPNTLLDSIHVALMRALRRYFEKLSSEGSETASKCLRSVDWSLLDSVTWPVYLIHYLMLMGYTDGPEWKGFYAHSLEREYNSLPVGRKLVILQILCDDVLDSEYLRAEIDVREVAELGSELEDDTTVSSVHVPRRVHPRNSKTSACKVQEAREVISRSHETKSYYNSSRLVAEALGHGVSSNVDQDANSDECLLCGMEGTLLCCDGCPASYHSRCLGVMKMFLPEGPWYCPECSINKLGPRILRGTALKGSDTFGVDLYGQVFVGTCDHLLVLNSRSNETSCLRYYRPSDIANVLQALQTSKEHISMYSGICKEIVRYWELPEDMVFLGETSDVDDYLSKEDSKVSAHLSLKLLGAEGHSVSEITESEDNVSYATGNSSGVMIPNSSSCNAMITMNHSSENVHGEATTEQPSYLVKFKVPGETQGTSTTFSGPFCQKTTLSDLCQKEASGLVVASCTSRNITSSCSENANPCVPTKLTVQDNIKRVGLGGRQYQPENDFFYLGSSFKIQGYVNHYLHGDFAASAAANMTSLSSEVNHVTGADRRKAASATSANMALQMKAFSSAAVRFFWPYTEKKLIEVPRERCGWCLACEANVTSKKGCLLNAAASNVIKGPMKILATLRPLKTGEGILPAIATYIIFMEESLSGLTVGPFRSASFRSQWRARMEQANTCSEIKLLLLELEGNLRTIALSGDWVKLVDGSSAESSVIQHSATAAGSTQKRRPGRRGRKPSTTTEVNPSDSQETDSTWWRGGMLSVLLYQKGLLPRPLVKKAARQGGSRKIHGIYYAEGSEAGKRSRRLVWRAAVDMSRTISQFALQVRYLDHHVRWSDLVHPENGVQDSKGPETEASAFRNAYICDKKVLENEVIYCIAFEKQKHLPSRVMKSIIEVEQSQDDNQKYWFPETRIPLYLIRKFEQNAAEVPSVDKPVAVKSKLRRRHLEASMADIMVYLARKRDNVEQQYCAFCHLDVFLSDEDSVRCSVCEGLFHKQCTSSALIFFDDGAEYVFTCKQCCNSQTNVRSTKSNGSPTSPLLLKGQECPNIIGPKGSERTVACDQSLAFAETRQSSSESKPSISSNITPKHHRSWGLIWKKKDDDDGTDFRINNILLKGETNVDSSAPVCHLCKKQYNSELMYIRCDTCTNWYHAEAVELEESKIFELAGFKCCKCRRIKSPACPYDTSNKKRTEEKRIRIRGPKPEGSNKRSGLGRVRQPIQVEQEVSVDGAAEQSTRFNPNAHNGWSTGSLSGSAPQKLPVSRKRVEEKNIRIKSPKLEVSEYKPDLSAVSGQIQAGNINNSILPRREDSVAAAVDGSHLYSHPRVEEYTQYSLNAGSEWNGANLSGPAPQKLPVRRHTQREMDANNSLAGDPSNLGPATVGQNTLNSSVPCVEWGVSTNGFDDSVTINYDTLSYEDMEFEPQTYFSFNELLASNESGPPDGAESSVNVAESWENSCLSQFPNYGVTDSFNGQEEPSNLDELAFDMVPCKMCSLVDPCPDLFCQFCGIWIHSHCSPWDELSVSYDSWSCGDCRTGI